MIKVHDMCPSLNFIFFTVFIELCIFPTPLQNWLLLGSSVPMGRDQNRFDLYWMIHRPLRCKQWVLSRAWDMWLETWVPVLIQQQRSAESSDWRWKLLPHVLTSPQQKFSRGNMVSPRHGVPHTYTLSTQETEAGGLPKVWGYSGIGSEYNAIHGYIWRDYMKK